jgi:L-lactate dehydrogenase complex protein LldE
MNDRNVTVQLFVTCLIDTIYPEIGEAVVRVLERAGLQVEFPQDQTCCGQPAFNAGLWPEARALAEHTIQVFENTSGPIVVPSGSCAAMLRHHYQELFADDPLWLPRVHKLAARTFEFTEYLVDQLGIVNVGAQFNGLLTYHSSCHLLRLLGVDRQPRALLARVQGAQVVELSGSQECCGFGGVFSLEHPELSAAMLDRKIANIEASGADTVVACDAGCLIHINGGLHRQGKKQRAVHIAQILEGRVQGVKESRGQG